MPTLSPQSQALFVSFGQQPGVTPDQVKNLQDIVNASPALIDRINHAVAQGHLKHIVPLANPNAGGEYDPDPAKREMRLPLAKLTSPPKAGELTFVLGHELQHGFNAADVKQAGIDFAKDVRNVAKSHGPVHDYTPVMVSLLAANRRDEAGAEIAGWNAIVSAVKNKNTNPTLGDIYEMQPGRMSDFVDKSQNGPPYTYALKPNLSLNADMTMVTTPANIEAMGKNYFDKPPQHLGGLGPSASADYINYYAATLVGYVAEVERSHNPPKQGITPPRMTFNMAQLHLSEKLLEEKGINLGTGNTGQQTYYDSSHHPPSAHIFQHTINTHQHTNPILAQTIEEDRAQARAHESVPGLQPSLGMTPQAQVPDSPLRFGDRGTEVLTLQASLIQLGVNEHIKTPVQANGTFDQQTQRALMAFQLQHGLDATGIADPSTREAVQQQTGLAIAQRASGQPQQGQPEQQGQQEQQAREQQERKRQAQHDQRLQTQHAQQAHERQAQYEHQQRTEQEKHTQEEQRDREQQTEPALRPFSDPKHPEHELYADLKQRLEAQGHSFPEDRLHQIVGALHDEWFKPGWRGAVDVKNDSVYVRDNDRPWARSQTLLQEPAPSLQDTMQLVQQKDLEKAQQRSQSPDTPTQGPTR